MLVHRASTYSTFNMMRTKIVDVYSSSPCSFFFTYFPQHLLIGTCFSWCTWYITDRIFESISKTLVLRRRCFWGARGKWRVFPASSFPNTHKLWYFNVLKGRIITGQFRKRISTAVGLLQAIWYSDFSPPRSSLIPWYLFNTRSTINTRSC